jgi:hypothetical protein
MLSDLLDSFMTFTKIGDQCNLSDEANSCRSPFGFLISRVIKKVELAHGKWDLVLTLLGSWLGSGWCSIAFLILVVIMANLFFSPTNLTDMSSYRKLKSLPCMNLLATTWLVSFYKLVNFLLLVPSQTPFLLLRRHYLPVDQYTCLKVHCNCLYYRIGITIPQRFQANETRTYPDISRRSLIA